MSSEGDKTVSNAEAEQTSTYVIRSIEVKRGIAYDVNNVHYTAVTGLTAEVPPKTPIAFTVACLERFCDERNRRILNERPQQTREETTGLPCNPETLHFFQSIKKPDLWLTSKDCETFRQLLEYINAHGPIHFHGYSYVVMPDGTTIGRMKVT